MNPIKLSAFREQGSKIRVNDEYVVTSIEMSDLCYLINHTGKRVPSYFAIEGKEATVEVYAQSAEKDEDGDVRSWRYLSMKPVITRDGPRLVSVTVFND